MRLGQFGLRSATAVTLASRAALQWTYQGCYLDNSHGRVLAHRSSTSNDSVQTVELCTTYCENNEYDWAGLEYGSECYCDYQLDTSTKEPESDCSMPCAGNSTQICGNGNRLSVYATGISSGPSTNPGPDGWSSLGCYTDSTGSRSLRHARSINPVTVAGCTTACKAAGYSLAGLEYASECYCDNTVQRAGAAADSGCNMLCSGNLTEYCGGANRLNLYQAADRVAPTRPSSTPVVASGWASLGCYTDDTGARTLSSGQDVPGGADNNTIEGCLTTCANRGFSYAGLEYSQECYCGNDLRNGGACVPDQSTCSMACSGNDDQVCGGPNRLNIYYSGSDSAVVACSAIPASTSSKAASTSSSSSSSSTDLVRSTTSSAAAASSSTSSSASPAVSTTSTTSSASSASSSATVASSSSTSAAPTSTSSTSSSSSSSVAVISTSSSSSTTSTTTSTSTSTTPVSTVCPTFWQAVVNDLAPLMRVNGQCNIMARAAIRYAFHDSATFSNKLPFYAPAAGGADGSLLLSQNEINRPDNDGLQDYHGQIGQKFNDYKAAGYNLTAADLIQVAGAIGVLACPGGRIGRVLVGRGDTTTDAPDGLLPAAFGAGSDHDTLLQLFVDKGFTARDLAALIGAHTTSIANFQTSHGIPAGTPQDSTPGLWDVAYYNETYFPPAGIGRFDSDINLSKNVTSTVGKQFKTFVGAQGAWGASFSSAFQTLSLLGVPQSVRRVMQDCTVIVGNAPFP